MANIDALFSVLDVNTNDDLQLSSVLAMQGAEAPSEGCSCSCSCSDQPELPTI